MPPIVLINLMHATPEKAVQVIVLNEIDSTANDLLLKD